MVYAVGVNRSEKSYLHHLPLFIFMFVLIVSILITAFSYPRIVQSIQESNVVELIRLAKERGESPVGVTKVSLFYPRFHDQSQSVEYVEILTQIDGRFTNHLLLEHLLKGPPRSALKEGVLSTIDPRTKLIGLSVSQQVAFVDLSEEFLKAHPLDKDKNIAITQIKKSLQKQKEIKDVILLVEGKVFNQTNQK